MNPHTPFILVAYATATLVMLVIAVLPIFHGHRLRRELRNRADIDKQRHNTTSGTKS